MAAIKVETEKIDKVIGSPVEPRKLKEAIEYARKKLGVDNSSLICSFVSGNDVFVSLPMGYEKYSCALLCFCLREKEQPAFFL